MHQKRAHQAEFRQQQALWRPVSEVPLVAAAVNHCQKAAAVYTSKLRTCSAVGGQ